MNTINDLQVGRMSLSFSQQNGFSIEYGGASIIKESSLRVMKPGWLATYYSLESGKQNITINDIPGGKEIVISHDSDSFTGEHRITMLRDKITFDLRYKLLADIDDAGIEYTLGYISAPLITGCKYEADTYNGYESGTIPLNAISAGWDGFVTKSSFKKMSIDSRVGKITMETNGEPNDLILVDARGLRVTWAEKCPIFTLGAFRKILKKDEEKRSVVSLSFEPLPETAKPVIENKDKPISVKEVSNLRETTPKPVVIIPEPKEIKLLSGDFILSNKTQIVVGEKAGTEDYYGAKSFATEVRSLYNIKLPILRESEATSNSVILVGEAALNQTAAKAARANGISAPEKEEGYAIKITPKQAIVLGYDQRGSYYGMQTLKQLVKASADDVMLQGCEINDYPSLKIRGIHIYTGKNALPFHRKLIDNIISRYKMNFMIIECDLLQWKSATEVTVPYAMTQEDLKKELEYAKEHFIEVIPQVSSLGHMNWMFMNKQHWDLAEDHEHPYAYCPSNPKSYEFIFKVYDEAIELFNHPRYFHIGHDEVTSVEAKFPCDEICSKKSVGDLFIQDTLKVYNHLKEKGVGVMMWGDMLLAPGESPDACNMPDAKEAARLRSLIPGDVIITDWHYAIEGPEHYHSLKLFQDQGLKCLAATWYTPANIIHFSQAAKDNNSLGLLQTTWAGFDSSEQNLIDQKDQFTAYVLAAEYAWSSGKTSLEKLPYQADGAFFSQWNRDTPVRHRLNGFTVDLSSFYNIELANKPGESNWIGSGAESDLSSAPTGIIRLGDDLFKLADSTNTNSAIRLSSALDADSIYPKSVTIPIGEKANSLIFLHTCVWNDTPDRIVGSYTMNYQDGESKEIDLVYRKNIGAWTDLGTCANAVMAWHNELPNGQRIILREFEWTNPHPEKVIRSVVMKSTDTDAGPVLIGLSGISAP